MSLENINVNVSFNSLDNLKSVNNASNVYKITKVKNYNDVNINNKNLNYNMECYDIEDIENDTKNLDEKLIETGATLTVGFTSILSGVGSFIEYIDDGLILATGTISSRILDLIGLDDLAEDIRVNTKEEVKVDKVGELNKLFYEETELGRNINEKSRLKYDSEEAKKIHDITVKNAEFAAATAITFGTLGTVTPLVLGIGFLEGVGKSANKRYKDPTNEGYETGAIFLDGVGSAFNWYSGGKLGAGGLQLASIISKVGLNNTVSTFSSLIINGIKNFKISNLFNNDIWKKATKSGILDFDNFVDSAGVVVDNFTDYANGGELDVFKMLKELLATYGLNCVFDGASSVLLDSDIIKGLGSEIDDIQSKISRYNYLKSVIETDDYQDYAFKLFNDYTVTVNQEYDNIYSEFLNLKNELSGVEDINELIDFDFDPDQAINSGTFARSIEGSIGFGEEEALEVGVTKIIDNGVVDDVSQRQIDTFRSVLGEDVSTNLVEELSKYKNVSLEHIASLRNIGVTDEQIIDYFLPTNYKKVEIDLDVSDFNLESKIMSMSSFDDLKKISREEIDGQNILINGKMYDVDEIYEYLGKYGELNNLLEKKNKIVEKLVDKFKKFDLTKEDVDYMLRFMENSKAEKIPFNINSETFMVDNFLLDLSDMEKSQILEVENLLENIKIKPYSMEEKELISKFGFREEILNFFRVNEIDFVTLYNTKDPKKLVKIESSRSHKDEVVKSMVSIADIVGIVDDGNRGYRNIISEFNKCFGVFDGIYSGPERVDGFLKYNSSDELIKNLWDGFSNTAIDPMIVQKLNTGEYFVESGYHRYSILRLLFLNESLNVTESELEELVKKYTIPILVN